MSAFNQQGWNVQNVHQHTNVTAVWLRSVDDYLEVLVEIDGEWRVLIRELAPLNEQTISHIAKVTAGAQ